MLSVIYILYEKTVLNCLYALFIGKNYLLLAFHFFISLIYLFSLVFNYEIYALMFVKFIIILILLQALFKFVIALLFAF